MLNDVEYRPVLLPRRGEWLAWLAGLGLMVGLYFADARLGEVPSSYWIFAGLIILFALSISLGNWMDRRSRIRIVSNGIDFENGLRSVKLNWSDIQNVVVVPTRLGKRIEVKAGQSHFAFKTMWQSSLGGQDMRTGYPDGQVILDIILKECGLLMKAESGGSVYYARS